MLAVLLSVLLVGRAAAHDFWIEPTRFLPAPGAAVGIGLRVGEEFVGDAVPRRSNVLAQFTFHPGGGGPPTPITGTDGMSPAGFVLGDGRQTALIAYAGGGGQVEMPADRFTAYLRQHGLESIIADRERRGESGEKGREAFHRHAKALLTGGDTDPVATQSAGLLLEIVPMTDPTRPGAGPFTARVLWQGAPLPGLLVQARNRADPGRVLSVRSDDQGQITLPLDRGGVWLIMGVWMVRGGWFDAQDWHSHWTSLTFLRPEAQ